jgi:hypothetical protein
VKVPSHILSATTTGVASLTAARTKLQVFTTTATGVASIVRAPQKVLNATATGLVVLARMANITFTTIGSSIVTLTRQTANSIELITTAVGNTKVLKIVPQVLSTTTSLIASLSTHLFEFVGYVSASGYALTQFAGTALEQFKAFAMKPFNSDKE